MWTVTLIALAGNKGYQEVGQEGNEGKECETCRVRSTPVCQFLKPVLVGGHNSLKGPYREEFLPV